MSRHRSVMGAWLHGLLEYILGNGKVITKLMIDPFVNGLWLVIIVFPVTVNWEIFVSTKFRLVIFVYKYFQVPANLPKLKASKIIHYLIFY